MAAPYRGPVTLPQPVALPVTLPQPVALPVTLPQPVALPVTLPQPVKLPVTLPQPTSQPPTVIQPTLPPKELTPEAIDPDTIVNQALTLNKEDFDRVLKLLSDYYHNDQSLVPDETYDELIDIYEAKYGPYTVVGAEPQGLKVQLPYYLGSLRKLKQDEELNRWIASHPGPYIIEDKIDGLTLLLVSRTVNSRRETKLYTRGGGVKGTDVSHLLQYVPFPPINEDIAVRGEIVMNRDVFMRMGTGFKNARNLVSGVVNAKKSFNPELAKAFSFYAYRIMDRNLTPAEDITTLQALGFLVPNPVQSPTINHQMLTNYFQKRHQEAPYEMDGLVVYQNIAQDYPVGENPRHVVAFKTGSETGVTTVTAVTWEASKQRLLKPVVHYQPIFLSGAELSKASGYNGRFIVNNKIGPGAQILLTRSGDVIPKILSVLAPAPAGPSYPDPAVYGQYSWNANNVEFVITEDTEQVLTNRILHFLKTLGIKNSGPARVAALVKGGITSVSDLLNATPQQLAAIPGVGPGVSQQLYRDVQATVSNIGLPKIMDASGFFSGIGERRFEALLEGYPNFLEYAYQEPSYLVSMITQVHGFSDTLAAGIANNMSAFATWLTQHPMIRIAAPAPVLQIQPAAEPGKESLAGKTIVFSGKRDRPLEARIVQAGGKIGNSVSGNTSYLVMEDITNLTGKGNTAQQKGVPILTKADFVARFF